MSEMPLGEASAGAILRAAREKQGLHIAALAAAIKVAPRKLDALEHDRWDELPDATFVRALAQTVCRTLKIESGPVLKLLPPAGALALGPQGGGLNAPFRDRPGRDEPGLTLGATRPMVWAAGLLMLAAVAVYFVPDKPWTSTLMQPAPPSASVAVPAASTAPALADAASEAASSAAFAAAVEPLAAASATAAAAVPSASKPEPPAGLLQLRTSDQSWVEIKDGGGKTLVSRLLRPGENLGLDGSLPLRLTIGNASAMRLEFRGQTVDLAASTRDNVARVELK